MTNGRNGDGLIYLPACKAELLEDGSLQEHIWGADCIPDTQQARYEALMNAVFAL